MLDELGGGRQGGIVDRLAPLVDSCITLGRDASERLAALLVGLLQDDRGLDAAERCHAALALFVVGAHLDAHDPRLDAVAQRVLELEAAASTHGYAHPEHGFVLGLTHHDARVAIWQRLLRTALAPIGATAARPALAQLVARLSPR